MRLTSSATLQNQTFLSPLCLHQIYCTLPRVQVAHTTASHTKQPWREYASRHLKMPSGSRVCQYTPAPYKLPVAGEEAFENGAHRDTSIDWPGVLDALPERAPGDGLN